MEVNYYYDQHGKSEIGEFIVNEREYPRFNKRGMNRPF